jgi:hypothetical protein
MLSLLQARRKEIENINKNIGRFFKGWFTIEDPLKKENEKLPCQNIGRAVPIFVRRYCRLVPDLVSYYLALVTFKRLTSTSRSDTVNFIYPNS